MIFNNHKECLSKYNRAAEVVEPEQLHFRFEAGQQLLRVPLEFLYSEMESKEPYFVLKYPMARSISNIQTNKKSLSPSFFTDLHSKKEALRILLIGSNTIPSISGVDSEIDKLESSLKTIFENKRISVRLNVLRTQDAIYDDVREELRNCKYHIIHYAGHGNYDKESPERSFLSFWERPNKQGDLKKMPVTELKTLLENSDVRFVYLSCCLGATTGQSDRLLDNDFLGIADGLIYAGIPSVLGFRWPVSDTGAIALSEEFYKSLAKQGQIDTALLHARREVAARNRDDITWLSPILIMQQ